MNQPVSFLMMLSALLVGLESLAGSGKVFAEGGSGYDETEIRDQAFNQAQKKCSPAMARQVSDFEFHAGSYGKLSGHALFTCLIEEKSSISSPDTFACIGAQLSVGLELIGDYAFELGLIKDPLLKTASALNSLTGISIQSATSIAYQFELLGFRGTTVVYVDDLQKGSHCSYRGNYSAGSQNEN